MKTRPEDQPLPTPANGQESMHDLLMEHLTSSGDVNSLLLSDLILKINARKQVGIERYGEVLHVRNGRDASQDLMEELLDAAVYALQMVEESGSVDEIRRLWSIYQSIQTSFIDLQRILQERKLK